MTFSLAACGGNSGDTQAPAAGNEETEAPAESGDDAGSKRRSRIQDRRYWTYYRRRICLRYCRTERYGDCGWGDQRSRRHRRRSDWAELPGRWAWPGEVRKRIQYSERLGYAGTGWKRNLQSLHCSCWAELQRQYVPAYTVRNSSKVRTVWQCVPYVLLWPQPGSWVR